MGCVANFYFSLESVDEFVSADKIEPVHISVLLENTTVEVVYIKLPELGASQSMDF